MGNDPWIHARRLVARTEYLLQDERFRDLSEVEELARLADLHASDTLYDWFHNVPASVIYAHRESVKWLESEVRRLRATYFLASS